MLKNTGNHPKIMEDQARFFKCDFGRQNRFLVIFHGFWWLWRLSEGKGEGTGFGIFFGYGPLR